jgi:hypothetical protein
MSGRIQFSFVDFAAFSSVVERVRSVSGQSFPVRNWCGVRLVVGFNELRPSGPNIVAPGDRRACQGTAQLTPSGSFSKSTGVANQPIMTIPRYLGEGPLLAQADIQQTADV